MALRAQFQMLILANFSQTTNYNQLSTNTNNQLSTNRCVVSENIPFRTRNPVALLMYFFAENQHLLVKVAPLLKAII